MKKNWRYRLSRGLWISGDTLARSLEPLWLRLWESKYNNKQAVPPIFIIGAPRSGTTLVYQAFIYYFDIAYMTNLMAEFYHAPYLATALSKHARPGWEFKSLFGKTRGIWGPHEGGQFWYRWFPQGPELYVGPGEMSESNKISLRNTMDKMTRIAGRQMMFKNTFHSMRIAPLVESFPECLFVVCHRDPADTSQSILQARIQNNGSPETWWSLPPREYPRIINHPYWEQVVEQVYFCYRQIEQDRQLAPDRFIDLSYEEFCLEPNTILETVKEKTLKLNLPLQKRANHKLDPFTMRSHRVDKRINAKVRELWP